MNLLLDFLKSRRSVRWVGHLLGLIAGGVWLSLDVHPLAGLGAMLGLGTGLLVFEVLAGLLDAKSTRLKQLAPVCFPLKNLPEADRALVQHTLAKMPLRIVGRVALGWVVVGGVFMALNYNATSVILAVSLGLPVAALAQGWGSAVLLKRVLPFFYFEDEYAKNLGRWLPDLGSRFRRSLLAPWAVILLPLAASFATQHELGLGALLWILVWAAAAVFGTAAALQSLVAEPIQDLHQALGRFGQGDLQALLDVTSGDEIGHATETYNKTLRAVDRRFFVLERFGFSVSPAKSDAIFEGGLRLDGELKAVAVLECAWHNVHAVTREMDPPARLGAMNRFYEVVQDAVDKAGGSVMDAGEGRVLACWGAPLADEQPVTGALTAAWALQAHLKVWANQQRLRGTAAAQWGLAVASGQATVGLLGPRGRQRFNVLGGPVSEVESLAQRQGGPWVDERSAGALKAPFAAQILEKGAQLIAGPEPEAPSAADLGFSPGERL